MTSNLVKLKRYQMHEIENMTLQLPSQRESTVWRSLMEHIYTWLVIYNHRSNETAKLLPSSGSDVTATYSDTEINTLATLTTENVPHDESVMNYFFKRGKGTLIYARKKKRHVSLRKYLPCVECFSMFLTEDLYSHTQNCLLRSDVVTDKKLAKSQSRFILSKMIPKFKSDILDSMHQHNISKSCRSDNTIMKFRLSLYQNLRHLRSHDISNRMQKLARLL